jgi:phosphoribosyl-ATP pyrophosphohydrolase/phosphoribosyl-AMP cyclohydrolase
MTLDLDRLDFAKGGGLVTVVAQDAITGAVLMVAHADRDSLERTLATGEMHYRSRTRGPWRKGETSGNVQRVVALEPDCDGDAVLARVVSAGPACHTGEATCFGEGEGDALESLARVIEARWADSVAGGAGPAPDGARPDGAGAPAADATPARFATTPPGAETPSYTKRLLADRNLRLKKLGEETAELVMALADGDRARAAQEAADLAYHLLVALRAAGVTLDQVRRVLAARAAR